MQFTFQYFMTHGVWASVPTLQPLTMFEIVVSIHVHPSMRAVFLKVRRYDRRIDAVVVVLLT
jgi:hypothetical protein